MSDQTPTVEAEVEVAEKPRSIFDLLETDADAEENGRWFRDVFDDGTNIDLKLRRMTSKASIGARRNLEKQYKQRANKRGEYDDETTIEIIGKQIASGIIVDWDGVYDRDGSKMECTVENRTMLIQRLPALRDAVIVISQEMDNFRIKEKAETEKN